MVEFVIDQRIAGFDLASVEGRVGALRAAAPVVAELRDPLAAARVRPRARPAARPGHRGRAARGRARRPRRHRAARADAAPPPPSEEPASRRPRHDRLAAADRRCRARARCADGVPAVRPPDRSPRSLGAPSSLPFRHPALDAVRAGGRRPHRTCSGPGGRRMPSATVREPYRSLAAELLTADFPALTDEAAVASAADLARRLVVARARPREDRAARCDPARPADSTEGRVDPAAPARARRRAPASRRRRADATCVALAPDAPRTAG